jgi:hypothetical protein
VKGGEILSFPYYPFASSKPQVTGDVSPGPNLPKKKEPSIVVTLGGIGSSYTSLAFYPIAFYPSHKLCAITVPPTFVRALGLPH